MYVLLLFSLSSTTFVTTFHGIPNDLNFFLIVYRHVFLGLSTFPVSALGNST